MPLRKNSYNVVYLNALLESVNEEIDELNIYFKNGTPCIVTFFNIIPYPTEVTQILTQMSLSVPIFRLDLLYFRPFPVDLL